MGNFIWQKEHWLRLKYNHHITFEDFFLHDFVRFKLLVSHFVPSAFQKVRHGASSDICSACIITQLFWFECVYSQCCSDTRSRHACDFLGSTCLLVASLWLIFSLKGNVGGKQNCPESELPFWWCKYCSLLKKKNALGNRHTEVGVTVDYTLRWCWSLPTHWLALSAHSWYQATIAAMWFTYKTGFAFFSLCSP